MILSCLYGSLLEDGGNRDEQFLIFILFTTFGSLHLQASINDMAMGSPQD
jgi:hypothetical protein